MPYSSNAPLQALFASAPAEKAALALATGGRDLLRDRALQRTPVSKPTEGHSPEQALADRNFRKPGKMRDSWEVEPVAKYQGPAGVQRYGATVHNTDAQAVHVEWPTRPHIIRPRLDRQMADGASNASNSYTRKPRGLRQLGTARLRVPMIGGGYAFPKEVHHPGTQGVHMMRNALQDVEGEFATTVGENVLKEWVADQMGLVR